MIWLAAEAATVLAGAFFATGFFAAVLRVVVARVFFAAAAAGFRVVCFLATAMTPVLTS
ncbi:hypothetical protein [Reinekea marinisedimentorum]|uniref:hypothetical protein n=1 Tax=Reinekea marinisedimentorum TaxID=230495 RepID=UPI0014043C9D|nr:hypothetical protein [Reinekea marinisedimentorum]